MWDRERTRQQSELEIEQLRLLIETHRSLLTKCATTAPDAIERSALATLLHSFYTGIENILKRTTLAADGGLPKGASWHRDLLESMTKPSSARKAVLSVALRERLQPYLEFRHVFRQAYSFQLQWEKMAALVLGCEEAFASLQKDLDAFFRA